MTTRRATLLLLLVAALGALGVPGAAPAGADDVPAGGETAERCFVGAAHGIFLDREATEQELDEWTEAFEDGTPHHVLVREMAESDEWLAVTVTDIYQRALERDPEPSGLAYWVGELRDGALVNRIGALIFGSAEFYGLAGGTDEGFVEALYDRILDRAPDSTGLAYWVGEVDARGRGGVASEFYASYESRAMRVDGLYQRLLGRDPSPADLTYWADRLRAENDVQLAILIASSPEFADRTRSRCRFAVHVTTEELPAGTVGVAYAAPLAGGGGKPPYTWTATGLPAGLAVSGQQITGTPTAAGTFDVDVEVTDAEGGTEQAELDLVIASNAPTITTGELNDTRAAVPFAGALAATGGTPPYTWTATGLPDGLTLSGADITGAATEVGVHTVEVEVTDDVGGTDRAELVLEVIDAAIEIETGIYHSCAALASGVVTCWGFNGQGQLGVAGTETIPGETVPGLTGVTDIAAGAGHSCAVTGGQVRCWGADTFGALGHGAAPATPGPVTVSGLTDAVAIDAESSTTCAVRGNGRVRCWGAGTRGQLGNGGTIDRTSPVNVSGLTDAEQVAVGPDFACALRATGAVMCWGADDDSQLGTSVHADSPTPVAVAFLPDAVAISAGHSHVCAVRDDQTVVCWGGNDDGQLGDGSTTERTTPVDLGLTSVVAIGAGIENTCSVRSNGVVRCWGTTDAGALGQGSIPPAPSAQTTPLVVPGTSDALTVEIGDRNVFMRGEDAVRAWGHNGAAQLGDGSGDTRPSPVTIFGI
ncbi:MAG TPA: DUF4214 domain-containing protein [Iamia sp.]